MNKNEKFIYIKAPADFCDLEDLFHGKYFRSYKRWRFTKDQEQEVLSYLEVDEKLVSELNQLPENETKSRRLHRSNSFNASEDETETYDERKSEKRPLLTKSMISYRKKQIEREKKDLEEKIKINQN